MREYFLKYQREACSVELDSLQLSGYLPKLGSAERRNLEQKLSPKETVPILLGSVHTSKWLQSYLA